MENNFYPFPRLTCHFFRHYGWTGADGVYTHVYHNKIIWHFSDTFIGQIHFNKRMHYRMIHNSLAVSNKYHPTNIHFLLPSKSSDGFFIPQDKTNYYWLEDGIIIDDYFYLFALKIENTHQDNPPFKVNGVDLLKISLLTKDQFKYNQIASPLLSIAGYTFGAAVLDNRSIDGWVYIYGYSNDLAKNLVVARIKENDIEHDIYELYEKNGFIPQGLDPQIIAHNFAPEFNVALIDQHYYIAYIANGIGASINLVSALTPVGPFTKPQIVYHCPEFNLAKGIITYNAKLHPMLSNSHQQVISYNVNTLKTIDHRDGRIYYPRFIQGCFVNNDK